MGDEGRTVSVADLISDGYLAIGDGYRAKNSELSDAGLPFARAGNINNGFHFDDADRFPEAHLERVGEKISRPGDVVFTSKGTVGRFGFVTSRTPQFVYSPQLCYWRSLDDQVIEPRFLYYWMHSAEFYTQVKGVSGQTDMALYVSLRDQRRMRITVPRVQQQRSIADVLGALDDKIELNRRMNETLEAMARALFKDWFVDFGPSRAAKAGEDVNFWPSRNAFPVALDDRGVPVGWRQYRLHELVERVKGSIKPSADPATVFEHFSLPAFDAGQEPARDLGSAIKSNKTPVPNGTILLSKLNPEIERVWLPGPSSGTPRIASTEFLVFKPRPPVGRYFVYSLFKESLFRQTLQGMVTGTSKSHQRVSPNAIADLMVVYGDERAFKAYEATAAPLLERTLVNRAEIQTLSALRDALLPKLVSGEITLKAAEKVVSGVA